MEQIYQIRGLLINIYKKYEWGLNKFFKFIMLLIMYSNLNSYLSNTGIFSKFYVTIALAAVSVFLTPKLLILLMILVVGGQLFMASMEVGILITIIMLVVFALYIRMFPELSYLILIVPLSFYFKMPLVVPIFAGLYLGLQSIIPVSLGIIVWSFIKYIPSLIMTKSESIYSIPKTLSDLCTTMMHLLSEDKAMIVAIIVFTSIIVISYLISKMSIDFSFYIAIGVSCVVNIIGFIMGILVLSIKMSVLLVIIESLLSLLVIVLIQFFRLSLNYARTERVQFEDDDYYYYVKAVPKIRIEKPKVKVKKITSKNH